VGRPGVVPRGWFFFFLDGICLKSRHVADAASHTPTKERKRNRTTKILSVPLSNPTPSRFSMRALTSASSTVSATRRAGPIALRAGRAVAALPARAASARCPRRRPIAASAETPPPRKARSGSDLASLATADVEAKAAPAPAPKPSLADRAAAAARASVAVALAAALLASPALAAGSGGRVGGTGGFSAARSAPSYSAPRSYGGGGGGGARYERLVEIFS
jgi:hypothetical protein